MSRTDSRPVHAPTRQDRPNLYLVGDNHFHHSHERRRTPGSGLAWARSYRLKLRISDTTIIVVSAFAAAVLHSPRLAEGATFLGLGAKGWGLWALIAGMWIVVIGTFHTRDRRIVGSGTIEYKRVITACTMTFGLLVMIFLALEWDFPRGYLVLALPVGVSALVLSRWLWRQWLTHQRKFGHYLSRVVVVGSREDVEYVVGRIDGTMGAAYAVVGVVLDGNQATGARTAAGFPIFCGLDRVADVASALGADAVIVAGQPSDGPEYIRNLAWQLEGTAAELILASRLANVAGPRIHFRPVEGLPLIHVEIPQFDGGRHVLKRALDIVVSALAIIMLLPLFLVLGVMVRLDSPGPALFSQARVGRNGKTFRMWKFRSMVVNADQNLVGLLTANQGAGPLFKLKDDPRVTQLGRILRKYSLDELPQLWNVLMGDMSLVGPRPPLPNEVLGYEGHVHRRLYIKPGLTGMWQVNGRSDLNWEDSVRLDLYYVENWSVVGDIVILWRTLKMLLHPVGAY